MPTESSVPPPTPPTQAQPCPSPSASLIKCSLCGAGGLSSASASLRSNEGVVVLHDPIERICGGCVRAEDIRRRMDEAVSEEGEDVAIGLGLRGIRLRETSAQSTQSSTGSQETDSSASEEEPVRPRQEPISILAPPTLHPDTSNSTIQSQSLPPEPSRSWSSTSRPSLPVPAPAPAPAHGVEEDTIPEEETDNTVPNNLLDICKSRIDSSGKGALHPGSIFKGTQTSGRSAYEVEVKIVVSSVTVQCIFGVRIDLCLGCQHWRIERIGLSHHRSPHRCTSTAHHLLHRRNYRSQIWIYHWIPIWSDRARRHEALGPIRAVQTPFHSRRHVATRVALPGSITGYQSRRDPSEGSGFLILANQGEVLGS